MYETRQNRREPRRVIDNSKERNTTQAYSNPNYKNFINNTNHILQLRTEIEYRTTSYGFTLPTGKYQQEIVGKSMHALLDPSDPVNGSEPGSDVQLGLMNYLKALNYQRMVRGHLLNAELGGLGIAANLYPITTQANSLHKYKVENHVKNELMNPRYTETNRLEYQVEAKENGEFPNVTFECHYGEEQSKVWDHNCDINSYPEKYSTGYGNTNQDSSSLSFLNRNLPQGWGHVGRGYDEDLRNHKKTIHRMNIDGFEYSDFLASFNLTDVNYNTGDITFEGFLQLIQELFYEKYDYDMTFYENFESQIEAVEYGDLASLKQIYNQYELYE